MLVRAKPFLDTSAVRSYLVSLGDENHTTVKEFENKFLSVVGSSYAIAVNQGRSALLLGLKSLNIKPGDEIIVQSFICKVVIDAIIEAGGTPKLVDSSLSDFNVSPNDIRDRITTKTRAIIVAHLYGIPSDIQSITEIAKENKCFMIEDCAHAIGSSYDGKSIGSFGDLSFFSFNFDKPISTGDGGMLIVNNVDLIDNVKKVVDCYEHTPIEIERRITYGLILQSIFTNRESYNTYLPIEYGRTLIENNQSLIGVMDDLLVSNLGENQIARKLTKYLCEKSLLPSGYETETKPVFRKTLENNQIEERQLLMNSLRARIGLNQLENLDSIIDIRKRNAENLTNHLDRDLYQLPENKLECESVQIRYAVLNHTKYSISEISQKARSKGYEIRNYNWKSPVHLIEPYSKILSYNRESLKNSEQLSQSLLNVPIHYYVNDNDLEKIIWLLNNLDE